MFLYINTNIGHHLPMFQTHSLSTLLGFNCCSRKRGAIHLSDNEASNKETSSSTMIICWAFSTVAAVEGVNKVTTRDLIPLCKQEFVDCDTSYIQRCDGGLTEYGFQFIIKNGEIETEEDYPYKAKDGKCDTNIQEHKCMWIKNLQRNASVINT
ncbi:hypothetical protein C5167_049854 [Papaver somniferum]|uniref:Peptidase C1A papain C-terminal domain-containing protein n=1 Tax=Papaver somniferum TaxID=3469 RepID=A0A4Y7KM00_PAPSO|nr:hypothetical protein C5167_049854 [Papaver somniferum]